VTTLDDDCSSLVAPERAHRARVIDEARETPAMQRSNDKALADDSFDPSFFIYSPH
jgi:hypothetical protein